MTEEMAREFINSVVELVFSARNFIPDSSFFGKIIKSFRIALHEACLSAACPSEATLMCVYLGSHSSEHEHCLKTSVSLLGILGIYRQDIRL